MSGPLRNRWYARRAIRHAEKTRDLLHELIDSGNYTAIQRLLDEAKAETGPTPDKTSEFVYDAADRKLLHALGGTREVMHRAVNSRHKLIVRYIRMLSGERDA